MRGAQSSVSKDSRMPGPSKDSTTPGFPLIIQLINGLKDQGYVISLVINMEAKYEEIWSGLLRTLEGIRCANSNTK